MLAATVLVLLFQRSVCEVLQPGSLVRPKLLEERGLNGERYLRINEDLTLTLEKSNILAKNFALFDIQEDNGEIEMVDGTKLEENLYHNTEHMSSLVVTPKDNGVEVKGILSHTLSIKPLPTSESSSDGLITHEVHEIHHPNVHKKVYDMPPVEARNSDVQNDASQGNNLTFLELPETYAYEIMIVMDKSYQRHFSRIPLLSPTDSVMTLMNSVQQRFAGMERPRIKLTVVGIARLESDDFHVPNRSRTDAYETLRRFVRDKSKYLNTTNFDAVLILTGTFTRLDVRGYRIDGLSYFGSVCTDHGVAIAEDDPENFEALEQVTRELGYVLGAVDDGDPPYWNISGHPGALDCHYDDGYVMGGYYPPGDLFYTLSECTKAQIRYVLSTKPASCTRRASDTDLLGKWFAIAGDVHGHGHGLSKKDYCDRLHPEEKTWLRQDGNDWNAGNDHYAINCQVGCCYPPNSPGRFTCRVYPLLDGQLCVENKTCKNGICGDHTWN